MTIHPCTGVLCRSSIHTLCVEVLCIICAGVHSGYVGSAWPLSVLGEMDAFFRCRCAQQVSSCFQSCAEGTEDESALLCYIFSKVPLRISECLCVPWGNTGDCKTEKWKAWSDFFCTISFGTLLNLYPVGFTRTRPYQSVATAWWIWWIYIFFVI